MTRLWHATVTAEEIAAVTAEEIARHSGRDLHELVCDVVACIRRDVNTGERAKQIAFLKKNGCL